VRSSDFFAYLELLPEPALVVDRGGMIAYANGAATRLMRGEAPTGQALTQVVEAPGAQRAAGAGAARVNVLGSERRALRVQDERLPVDVTTRALAFDEGPLRLVLIHPVCDAHAPLGEPPVQAGTQESARAGSDPVELAEALRLNEERLRLATQAAEVGIFDQPVIPLPPAPPFWSETLRAILGYDAHEKPDFVWFRERMHPDDGQILDAKIARAIGPQGDGPIRETEYRWLHPEKGYRWLMTRSVTHYSEQDGQRVPHRAVGAIIDITERRAAKEEQQLRAAILDATPDLVAITRLSDDSVVYLNRAARSFLGAGEGAELDALILKRAHPPGVLQLLERVAIPTALARGAWSAETEFIRHDGAAIPMSHVLLAQRDASGQLAYLCTIARDLSRERGLEEQFRQAQKLEAIGRLAGGVAHDFNNLLSVILSYASLASQALASDAQMPGSDPAGPRPGLRSVERALGQIVRAGERAAALTGQLLAFGRRQILKPRILDINDVLAEFAPMVSRLIDERIELRMLPAPEPAKIRADPTQVLQVLLNLVVNARDAMPEGGLLTVEAFRATVEENQAADRLDLRAGEYTVISVSDTGHGMDAATRSRIFEPFFTTKGPGGGTGLGLATVFGIVQQSGGSIWVKSEPGRGSAFKVYFPRMDEPADRPLAQPRPAHVLRRGVILISEDDEQVRILVHDILVRAGYEVLSAAHPMQALELAQRFQGHIDLLITDVMMPGMTGTVLARKLQELRLDLPVLFTSGYTEDAIVHQGVLAEGVHFLAKPITPERLLTAVLEVLQPAQEDAR
jgi:two-component system, cell cycle sensor histidine kinase and response regulator CckA